MRLTLCLVIVLSVAAPVAATDHLELTIASDIAGAAVYIGGVPQKTPTPMVMSLDVPDGFFEDRGACITTAPVVVRWVSGAEASLPGVEFCSRVGKEQILTFSRPVGWQGRETDSQFALKLQLMSPEQKEATIAAYLA